MINILSWNIQAAKGVDNVISVERIARDIKQLSDADVICLQEVMVTSDEDQVTKFAQQFPEHTPVFGTAIDRLDGEGRLQFGNLVLSRLPLLAIFQHKLPQPAEPSAKHMPRQAIEVLVDYNGSSLRIVTTHLEYFATKQRSAQAVYLAAHHIQSQQRYQHPSPQEGDAQFVSIKETADSIYCGDFNMGVDSPDYATIAGTPDENTNTLIDCWRHLYPEKPHLPTCGIFDHKQWQEGAHCRDFFFASTTLAGRVKNIEVDINTAASDHQPLVMTVD